MLQKSFTDFVSDNEEEILERSLEDESFSDACDRLYLDYEESWFDLQQ
jgi:hypothetical protein